MAMHKSTVLDKLKACKNIDVGKVIQVNLGKQDALTPPKQNDYVILYETYQKRFQQL